MGTDIDGWVEIKLYDKWYGVIYIRHLMSRSYDAFGCLFGVINYAGFRPIADNRGLPIDASDEVYATEYLLEAHSHSWIALSEIELIDWDEFAETLDQRVSQYHKDDKGNWILKSKSRLPNPPPIDVTKEGQVQVGDILYEVRRMQRSEVLRDWSRLFELMRMIGKPSDNVRLVVWFDN